MDVELPRNAYKFCVNDVNSLFVPDDGHDLNMFVYGQSGYQNQPKIKAFDNHVQSIRAFDKFVVAGTNGGQVYLLDSITGQSVIEPLKCLLIRQSSDI